MGVINKKTYTNIKHKRRSEEKEKKGRQKILSPEQSTALSLIVFHLLTRISDVNRHYSAQAHTRTPYFSAGFGFGLGAMRTTVCFCPCMRSCPEMA